MCMKFVKGNECDCLVRQCLGVMNVGRVERRYCFGRCRGKKNDERIQVRACALVENLLVRSRCILKKEGKVAWWARSRKEGESNKQTKRSRAQHPRIIL